MFLSNGQAGRWPGTAEGGLLSNLACDIAHVTRKDAGPKPGTLDQLAGTTYCLSATLPSPSDRPASVRSLVMVPSLRCSAMPASRASRRLVLPLVSGKAASGAWVI